MTIKRKSFFLTLLLFVAGMAKAPAAIVNIKQEKLSIEIPDQWKESDTKGALLSYADAQSGASAVLFALPNPDETSPDQPSLLKGIKNGMTESTASRGFSTEYSHEGPLTIHGVPFYLLQGVLKSSNSGPAYFRAYVTAANGKLYVLTLTAADPKADSALEDIANSFTFQAPPVLPDPSKRSKGAAERWGHLFGLVVGGVLGLFVFKRFYPSQPRAHHFSPKSTGNSDPRLRRRKGTK